MELVKIGELAKRAGVPIATLKHYLREGLIQPARKTGRTMAWYDASLASRVKAIKQLQAERFLPLELIKQTVEGVERAADDAEATEAIARVIEANSGTKARTRAELIERGVPTGQLEFLQRVGLAVPDGDVYRGDDLALLSTLGAARTAGITAEMLPFSIINDYLVALRALVEVELSLFRAGVIAKAKPGELGALTEAATRLSERLVVLLRRKLLLPTLNRLSRENDAPSPDPTRRVRKQQSSDRRRRAAGPRQPKR